METFCHKLPKIELHAHLNGSLSRTTLKDLGITDELITKYQTVDITLEDVFGLFAVAHKATSNQNNLYKATQSVIKEFIEDNVVYIELRTTPRSEETMSKDDYIQTVVKAIREFESSNIIVKLILCLDRRHSYREQADNLDLIIKYRDKYPDLIKGVDLCGDPAKGEFFKDLFQRARANKLSITMHCAEIENNNEVREMINFRPDRLGHGTFLHSNYTGNSEIWDLYKSAKIPVEICMTSNVVCQASKSYSQHHIQEWIKEELPFCLCTDDKGVFKTTLSHEFLLAQQNFNLGKLELWHISKNAVDYAFASAEEKMFLHLALEQWRNKNI